ncbi:unnamed protein product [Closterium sp. NIES-64]|nr:unnamed protein product [Closterium sp. NIES-64]
MRPTESTGYLQLLVSVAGLPLRFSIPIAIRTSPGRWYGLVVCRPQKRRANIASVRAREDTRGSDDTLGGGGRVERGGVVQQLKLLGGPARVVREELIKGEDAPHGHDGEGPEGVRPRVKVGQGGERGPRLVQQREDAAHKRHHGRQILQQREQRVGQACWGRGRADLRLVGGKGN